MILGAGRIFDARRFAAGLSDAMRRLVLVETDGSSGRGSCTGFLVTPSLVLCPAYALAEPAAPDRQLGVLFPGADEPRRCSVERVEILEEPESGGEVPLRLALLTLPGQEEGVPAMEFSPQEAAAGDPVSVVFYSGMPKAHLSVGSVTAAEGPEVAYDADTVPGSGGAPLFDVQWRVAGIHMVGKVNEAHNRGIGRAALMRLLQRSTRWGEIAAHYRMVDVVAVQKALTSLSGDAEGARPHPALVYAALRMSFDPSALAHEDRAQLEDVVLPTPEGRWMLLPKVRKATIAAMGSLAALRPFADPTVTDTDGQQVIKRILVGPPYDPERISEEDLAWWIQIAGWFTDVEPALPTPREIALVLGRKRTRSRLDAIAGPDFRGREDALAALEDWFRSDSRAPFCVSGIGGVGKSALVAHFASRLPLDTILLWLDFDRADLAADNAASILSRLVEQALPQVEDRATPEMDRFGRKQDVEALRKDLLGLLRKASGRPILLVLDSFEAAQYAGRYQELWPELETLGNDLAPARLKVLVSGRAPQRQLRLHGHQAESWPLRGLADEDVRRWLHNRGIEVPPAVGQIVRIARGLPLNLRLAYRLYSTGGDLASVPEKLPEELVAGFIYGRILNRVHNPQMAELAKGALVLQRLTAPMLQPVLGSAVKLPPGEPADLIRELAREAALVEGAGELQVRPEVRAAALELLEGSEPGLVRKIDEEATRWYAAQDTADPQVAGQLVYHRLRLGNLAGARAAWREGCEMHLQYAAETLRGEAREWLQSRMGASDAGSSAIEVYEKEASDRIRAARSKGKTRQVHGILSERQDRAESGALAFHQAFEMRREGGDVQALQLLERVGIGGGTSEARERAMLAALIHAESGGRKQADAILREWCDEKLWSDRRDALAERAAVQASRICFAVDVQAEEELAASLRDSKQGDELDGIAPMDIVSPKPLKEAQSRARGMMISRLSDVTLPSRSRQQDGARFLREIDRFRSVTLFGPENASMFRARQEVLFQGGHMSAADIGTRHEAQARVIVAAWRRLALSVDGGFFDTLALARSQSRVSRLLEAVVVVQALFTQVEGLRLSVDDGRGKDRSLEDALIALIEVLPLRSTFKTLWRKPLDFTGALKGRALDYCAGAPKPLELLVERLAGAQQTGEN
jgi:hypothetical protein